MFNLKVGQTEVYKEEAMAVSIEEKVKTKKKGWAKFLDRFVHFLMYGGWILLLIVVVGIWIAISMLTSGKSP